MGMAARFRYSNEDFNYKRFQGVADITCDTPKQVCQILLLTFFLVWWYSICHRRKFG